MARSKPKPKVWCRCADPAPLTSLVPEPVCRTCGRCIRRRPPGYPIQPTGPSVPEGPVERPPETQTAAYQRGSAMAGGVDRAALRAIINRTRKPPQD